MKREYRRFLIVRTDRIGDVILTLPMARVLKRCFPTSHVAMFIQPYTSEIVESNECIDAVLHYTQGDHPLPFSRLIESIRAQKFDVVFHTHPRFRVALLSLLAGIPVRVGTGYRWYSFLFNRKIYEHRRDARRHELEYNLNLLKAVGCNPDGLDVTPSLRVEPAASARVKALLKDVGIVGERKLAILHPGSGGSARDWNWLNFGKLAWMLSRQNEIDILISGGHGEEELVRRVIEASGKKLPSIVDKLNLTELTALAGAASLFIANSTGPIHIAAAVGTPVIGLYPQLPSLSAARWGPYTKRKTIFTPKNKPLDCNVCVRQNQPLCECMETITVEDVCRAALSYLGTEAMVS